MLLIMVVSGSIPNTLLVVPIACHGSTNATTNDKSITKITSVC